ncbi:MAG TPA: ImmA/IrrE family metallo-endopeptidase [Streptosporangiaceae bacterium]|jgi:Zn-dependent peptidase ImmA (M78 family)
MNQDPKTYLQKLRAFVPERGLEHYEATGIAERQATRLLDILDQREPPVDVGLIADLPRIEVRIVPNRELSGLSGLTNWVRERGHWLIAINRDDSQTRRRFTLGHEFKHILDNPFINVLYPKTQSESYKVHADDRAERMCDFFAACLLMPRPWVKNLWGQGVQDTDVLAATFNVSPAAMDRRLQELGLTPSRQRWRASWSRQNRTYFRKASLAAVAIATT